jgi:hypothetical protein
MMRASHIALEALPRSRSRSRLARCCGSANAISSPACGRRLEARARSIAAVLRLMRAETAARRVADTSEARPRCRTGCVTPICSRYGRDSARAMCFDFRDHGSMATAL